MLKNISIKLVALMVLVSGVLAGPLTALACDEIVHAQTGDVVKASGKSTVFYIAENRKRYSFTNDAVFKSWYPNYSKVKTINDAELRSFPYGGIVTFRPNTGLVKFRTSKDVYMVTNGGVLRKLGSPAVAQAIYGSNWTKRVVNFPDTTFTMHTFGKPVNAASDLDTIVITTNGTIRIPASQLGSSPDDQPIEFNQNGKTKIVTIIN